MMMIKMAAVSWRLYIDLVHLLCFHETLSEICENRLWSTDHGNWGPRHVCHPLAVPVPGNNISYECLQPKSLTDTAAKRSL